MQGKEKLLTGYRQKSLYGEPGNTQDTMYRQESLQPSQFLPRSNSYYTTL